MSPPNCSELTHVSLSSWVWAINNEAMDMLTPPWYPGQPNHGTAANYACLYTPDFMFHSCDNDRKIYALCQI